MKVTGNRPPAMLPSRARFQAGDLERNKALFAIPMLTVPTNFFTEVAGSSVKFQRLLVAAQSDKSVDTMRLLDSVTDGVHLLPEFRDAENNLKIDETFLKRCCARAGLSEEKASKLIQDTTSQSVKDQLIENTKAAVEKGAYGSPTMIIHGPDGPFFVFGSDRFEQIAFACKKEYLGPNPKGNSRM